MFKKIVLWLAVIGMSVLIFGFSSHSGEQSSGLSVKITESIVSTIEKVYGIESDVQRENIFEITHIIVRKGAHFTEFAVLGILSFLLLESYGFLVKTCARWALLYCLLFAICDEVHQLFVDGRAGKFFDVCIDFAGSFVGIMFCWLVCWHKKKKKI